MEKLTLPPLVVLVVAAIYAVTYVARRNTRYAAKGLEWALVAVILFLALLIIPLLRSANAAARKRTTLRARAPVCAQDCESRSGGSRLRV